MQHEWMNRSGNLIVDNASWCYWQHYSTVRVFSETATLNEVQSQRTVLNTKWKVSTNVPSESRRISPKCGRGNALSQRNEWKVIVSLRFFWHRNVKLKKTSRDGTSTITKEKVTCALRLFSPFSEWRVQFGYLGFSLRAVWRWSLQAVDKVTLRAMLEVSLLPLLAQWCLVAVLDFWLSCWTKHNCKLNCND